MHPAVGELVLPLVEGQRMLVGRSGGGAHVELNWDSRVSREHAALTLEGERLIFEDLNSRNGSWMGERRLKDRVLLERGQSVLIGNTVLELVGDARRGSSTSGWAETTEPGVDFGADWDGGQPFDEHLTTNETDFSHMQLQNDPPAAKRALWKGRFVEPRRVELHLEDQAAFAALWKDLPKQGLYMESQGAMPELMSRAVVAIHTPDGCAELEMLVVHVHCSEGHPTGVGLQLVEIGGALQERLAAYASGLTKTLDGRPERSNDQLEAVSVVSMARVFMKAYDAGRYYDALDLHEDAGHEVIAARLEARAKLFAQRIGELSPAQQARLEAAQSALAKVQQIMANQRSRLEYDFRAGYIRAEERIRLARKRLGPSLHELLSAWNLAHPNNVQEAAAQARRAFAVAQSGRYEKALELAEKALSLNPFFVQLLEYRARWEQLK